MSSSSAIATTAMDTEVAIPVATATAVVLEAPSAGGELTLYPANAATPVATINDSDNKNDYDSSCCCGCHNKHAIWILNLCFFGLYGILWLAIYLIDEGDAEGWDRLGQALFVAFFIVVAAFAIAVTTTVVTAVQWKRLSPFFRVLGCVPAIVFLILVMLAVRAGKNAEDDDPSTVIDCNAADIDCDKDPSQQGNLRW